MSRAGLLRSRRSLEDGEKRGRVGEKQALAAIEPQQVRVPVLGVGRRRWFADERRADGGEEFLGAPQDH